MSYKEDMSATIIILDQIIKILESVNKDLSLQSYIRQYQYFRNNCGCAGNEEEANDIRGEILRTYSQGMGSFNDLALCTEDGNLLPKHKEFYRLKSELFEILRDQL
jgi:hypothetical protein